MNNEPMEIEGQEKTQMLWESIVRDEIQSVEKVLI